uniref:RING-type E3 ubiquitin transferase n=1 Tax=Geotrypetes seraphini TaxID=260995 RepID=A0A6P8NYM4_GEOSA|nr:breast cancer type 1 susceptibility protein isoform X2 [Geotrypetes seraphini]
MAFSTLEVEEVHNVLAVMQKNLECPICLELMKEPVSTKCDHLFCRFCLLKLLSKKRRGLAECPMCKNEVTRRSIKESPRFKLLIEGLLKTIQAFEMDTGFKFSSSQDCTKKCTESNANEQLNKDGGTVHSRGYRRRQKMVQEHGQGEKPSLEMNSNVQHSGNLSSRRSQRNKRQTQDAIEPLCIDFGLDSSSEDLLEKAGSIGTCEAEESSKTEPESKECWADLKCDAKENGRPEADVLTPAKSDFTKTNHEDPGRIPLHVGNIKTLPVTLAEENLRENNDSHASDSQVEQWGSSANPSSLQNDAESFTCHAKGASPTQNILFENNKKWPKLDQRSKQELDTKIYHSMCDTHEGKVFKQQIDDLYDKELPCFETQLLPELSESNTCPISKKRVKRSLQRVNEWLSKNNEIFTSVNVTSELYPEGFSSWEDASDGESCISDKTELLANPMESSVVHNPDILLSKPATASVEDKVFGKTYKRERKSNPQFNMSFLSENRSTDNVAIDPGSTTKSIKRKRKNVCYLQPEDFIQKINQKEEEEICEEVNSCIIEKVPEAMENPKDAVDGCGVDEGKTADRMDFFPGQENAAWEVDTEQGKSSAKIIERLSNTYEQDSNKVKTNTVPRKKVKLEREHLNRTMQALELVNEEEFGKGQHFLVDGSLLQSLSNQSELQIDSYPSSEEARKAKVEQRIVRRSRRLQLLAEETSKETKRSCSSEKVPKVLGNEGLLMLQGGCLTDLALVYTELKESKGMTNCTGNWSDPNPKEKELDSVGKNVQYGCENFPLVKKGQDHLKTDRISESLHFSPAFYSESEGTDVQKSISPLQLHTPTTEQPIQMRNDMDATEKSRLVESGNELLTGISCFPDKDLESSRSKEPPSIRNTLQEVNPETEDSELDTQYLLQTFKGAKRMSFILQSSSVPEPVTQNLTSDTSRQASGSPLRENREMNREISSSEDTQIETPEFATFIKPTSEVNTVFETASTKHSDAIIPKNSTEAIMEHDLSSERNHVSITKNDLSSSENWQICPPSMRRASIKTRNRRGLQKRRILNICSTLPKIGLEDSNWNCKDSENSGELDKKSKQFLQTDDLSLSNDTKLNGETAEADQAEERSKLPVLKSQPEFTLLYATTGYLSPAAFDCRASKSKNRQGENEQVLNGGCQEVATDGVQINPVTRTTSSQDSAAERFLEHSLALKNSGVLISPTSSATPDSLLSSSNEIKKNTNYGEVNTRGKYVVDRKLVEERSLRKPQSSDSSGSQKLVKRYKRQAQKLASSEEGSSEDEDLPCYQRIFNQSLSTPSHSASQRVLTNENSSKDQGEALFLTIAEESQKKQLESPSREVHSVSPESVCSVNLFSSQSNGSEDFNNGAEEPKTMTSGHRCRSQCTNKRINHVETEEVIIEQSEAIAAVEVDHGEDQQVERNLGAGSGYESEASNVIDSSGFSSQNEILTTQRAVMQNNLKKMEQEMAALEAVLEQHATQVSETPGAVNDLLECQTRSELENETMPDKEKASFSTWDTHQKEQCIPVDGGLATRDNSKNISQDVNNARSPTPLSTPSESQLQERKVPEVAISLLKELKDSISQEDSSVPEKQQKGQETACQSTACSVVPGNTHRRDAEDKLNSRTLHCSKSHPPAGDISSAARPSSCQPGDELTSPCIPRIASRNSAGESEQKMPTPPFHGQTGVSSFKNPVMMTKRKLSLVASGLNQSELLLVQKFARKTQSVFSNQITGGTTHVIMKTDAGLVCERTLKYFLGIAGRKWVVSYQWIVQCFKEGKILNESDFEVRGDVINGRQHGGPRRARQAADGMLFTDFEICCSGPFTDMSTEHLEWMVELGGASVVKQPHLFTEKPTLTKLIVVQPDAAPEDTDYKAIQQQYGAVLVTREWVLDSMACYECQKFDMYLVFQS